MADLNTLEERLAAAIGESEKLRAQRDALLMRVTIVQKAARTTERRLRDEQRHLLEQMHLVHLESVARAQALELLLHSTSWRLTLPIRKAKGLVRRAWRMARPLVAWSARAIRPAVRKVVGVAPFRQVFDRAFPETSRLGIHLRAFLSVMPPGEEVVPMSATASVIADDLTSRITLRAHQAGLQAGSRR
ncbi:hypothetical protein [Pinirhizobacter sp.]|jgi:hypothetical protein|uniref:hypothetical protein n=1 Tax=Pinirhizobacter sp. TaxID=2950432 RepID=UPI002F41891A